MDTGPESPEYFLPWVFGELHGDPGVYEVRKGGFVPR
jgi:hypothetical protein